MTRSVSRWEGNKRWAELCKQSHQIDHKKTPIRVEHRRPLRSDYLVPGTEDPSGEHEEVAHGDQTRPDEQGEEAEHPLKDRLDADQDEDGQEEEECGGDGDEERQVVLGILGEEGGREKKESSNWSRFKLSHDTSVKRRQLLERKIQGYQPAWSYLLRKLKKAVDLCWKWDFSGVFTLDCVSWKRVPTSGGRISTQCK